MINPPDVERLRSFIAERFLPGTALSDVSTDTPLISSGVLDSLALLELIGFVEEQFGIGLAAHNVNADNFETIAAMCDLIAELRRGST